MYKVYYELYTFFLSHLNCLAKALYLIFKCDTYAFILFVPVNFNQNISPELVSPSASRLVFGYSPIVPSNMNVLLVGIAQEHKSHVVRPSLSTGSSTKKGGRGGGGTKRPFQRPCSLASKAIGEPNKSSSSSKMSNVTSPKLLKSSAELLATRLAIRGGLKVGNSDADTEGRADADADIDTDTDAT